MIPGVTKGVARVEPRWEDEIFLGVSDRSDELYVGTERGMHKVRTVRRREATERFDLTFLNTVTARPWDGPKSAIEVSVVLLDVSSRALMQLQFQNFPNYLFNTVFFAGINSA